MIDLDSLEALAKAATPGPWKNVDTPAMSVCDEIHDANGTRIAMALTTRHPRDGEQFIDFDQAEANAAFIAAANPATVLELIATVRQAQAERDWLANDIATKDGNCPQILQDCTGIVCTTDVCKKCWLNAAREAVEEKK